MQLQTLYANLRKYQNLKSNVGSISSYLSKTLESLSLAISHIQDNFLLDNETADKGKLKKTYSEIEELINSFENVIIPEINNKISKIKYDIFECELEMLNETE